MSHNKDGTRNRIIDIQNNLMVARGGGGMREVKER